MGTTNDLYWESWNDFIQENNDFTEKSKLLEQAERRLELAIQQANISKLSVALQHWENMSEHLNHLPDTKQKEALKTVWLCFFLRNVSRYTSIPHPTADAFCFSNIQKIDWTSNESQSAFRHKLATEFCMILNTFRKNVYHPAVGFVLSYLHVHYNEDITMEQLAILCEMTPNHLSQIYKKERDISIMQDLRKIRLEKAAYLLSSTLHNVQDIAMVVGYSDSNYFIRLFKKQYGITPNEYRKQFSMLATEIKA